MRNENRGGTGISVFGKIQMLPISRKLRLLEKWKHFEFGRL
jgi:hypothetical protein